MCVCVCVCVCVCTSYVKLGVVVDGGLTCELAQALRGTVIHHQAQRAVLDQQLDRVEEPIVHRLHAATNTHTHTHTHTETEEGEIFSMVPIMINYC